MRNKSPSTFVWKDLSQPNMSGRFSFLRLAFDSIRQSIRVARAKEIYVGSDQYGNKYYERVAGNAVADLKIHHDKNQRR